jgi:hypothetical protein
VRLFIFRPALRRHMIACALIAVSMTPRLAQADNDDLRKQIESLKNSSAPLPKNVGGDPDLQKALNELYKALQDSSCEALTDPVECNAKRVKDAIEGLVTAAASKKLSEAQKGALGDSVKNLQALLPAPTPEKDTKVVSIFRAYYGDLIRINTRLNLPPPSKLNDYRDDARACSATRSMQAYCQGKPGCWSVSDGTPVRQGVNLCGYEPAPYADPISKGLVVIYSCVSKKGFDLSEAPSEPKEGPDKHVVHFRLGETAQIACDQEPEKPAAAATTGGGK